MATLGACSIRKPDLRPEPMGSQARMAADSALGLLKLWNDSSLSQLGLSRSALESSRIGKDSLALYYVPIDLLQKFGPTKQYEASLINVYAILFQVESPQGELLTSMFVEKFEKENKWVVTRYGQRNLARTLARSRTALKGLAKDESGFYAVHIPSVNQYYLAAGTGKRMFLVPAGISLSDDSSRKKMYIASQVFREAAADSRKVQYRRDENYPKAK
jgi:hypothetical protein